MNLSFEEMTPGIREANAAANQHLREVLKQREKTMLSFDEYQKRTADTAIYPDAATVTIRLRDLGFDHKQIETIMEATCANALGVTYTGLGLGEIGEIQGKIKKILRDDGGRVTMEKRAAVSKELGDTLWYISQMATELSLDLESIASENLAKLASRRERGTLQGSGDDR